MQSRPCNRKDCAAGQHGPLRLIALGLTGSDRNFHSRSCNLPDFAQGQRSLQIGKRAKDRGRLRAPKYIFVNQFLIWRSSFPCLALGGPERERQYSSLKHHRSDSQVMSAPNCSLRYRTSWSGNGILFTNLALLTKVAQKPSLAIEQATSPYSFRSSELSQPI